MYGGVASLLVLFKSAGDTAKSPNVVKENSGKFAVLGPSADGYTRKLLLSTNVHVNNFNECYLQHL